MPIENSKHGTVIIIDDHKSVRNSLRALLESDGFLAIEYATAEEFLAEGSPPSGDCLVVDINMPGMSGLELQQELRRRNMRMPLIIVTGHADVRLAVQAMKAGAVDFLEKPFDDVSMLAAIHRAIAEGRPTKANSDDVLQAATLLALLTERERDVLNRLTLGESNKLVAQHLGISPRTVEIHRAHLQQKLNARSLADLVRIVRLSGQLL